MSPKDKIKTLFTAKQYLEMEKMIFCNTAWMDFYDGISNDKMIGGGKHIEETGWGHEMYNFKPIQGKYYGYVRVSKDRQINIDRFGAKKTDDKINGVTIVWTAKHPDIGGSYIVGWYKNATLFRYYHAPDKLLKRTWGQQSIGYCMIAKISDSRLLAKDERIIKVPRRANGMGQTNIWYADNNPEFVKTIEKYIHNDEIPPSIKPKKGTARQSDPLKRIEVESIAVKIVMKYYDKLGYNVKSVEKDNVGWDLNATKDKISLKLEVKGLSGKNVSVELTPNELSHLKADKKYYRLCIVTEALTKPKLRIFAFSKDNGKWSSADGMTITFNEFTGARVYNE